MVKINISYPPYGSSQLIEVDDEKKWRVFLDKRLSEEVPADALGDEFKGYVFKITGGYDKEGFSMMQGVMTNSRSRILLDGRTGQYTPKRHGCRKRKSVRGCIVGIDMSCINVTITKRGPTDLPKLTDAASDKPSIRGPKRANNIRKAWGLSKKDNVKQYVVKRVVPGKDGKKDRIKSPKIQRLITPVVKARRKRILKAQRAQKLKSRKEAADYANLLKQLRNKKRAELLSKRREAKSSKTVTKPVVAKDAKPLVAKEAKTVVPTEAKAVVAAKTGDKKPVSKITKPTTKKATTTATPKKEATSVATTTDATTTTTAKKAKPVTTTTTKAQPKKKVTPTNPKK